MSYILDALRKSEQQRQCGVAPRLLTVHTTPEANTRPGFLIYGLIAAALIGAGVVIGWWHPWQQEQLFSATESTAAKTLESRPRQSLPAPRSVLPEISRKSEQEKPEPVQKSLVAVKPAPAPKVAILKQDMHLLTRTPVQTQKMPPKTAAAIPKERTTPIREITSAPTLEKANTPFQEKFADAAPTNTSQEEQKVIPMAELPPAIQQEIPAMSIPVHTYSSTSKERIVGINGRLLQEGEYLAPGLKLEQIAPDGVVFSYKKYLFLHGL